MTDLPPGAPTPWAAPPAGTVTVYRGATLFDGTGDRSRADTTIVTDGARIHAVVGDGDPLPRSRPTRPASTSTAGSWSPA